MGVTAQGAPDFRIGGDPGSISTRAAVMMDRANEFEGIHSSLISLNSDGWTGRAADRFREKFKIQVQGWADAQEAFSGASSAYSAYASTLQSAQSQCDEIRSRWEQGRQAVEQAQNNKADARSQAAAEGGIPMFDASCDEGPGRATMQGAEADFQALVDEVNDSGTALIAALDAGIAKLPERTWGDAAWRTAGSILRGLFEGVDSMIKLMLLGTPNLCGDLGRLWGGSITPAEFQAKYLDIPLETVSSIASAIANDPGAFFTELGKALVDWDTWSDDPGRAFGRILPDIAITIATAGAAAGAKGLTGSARLAYIGREVFLQTTHISDIQDIGRLSSALVKKIGNMGSHAATSMAGAVKHIPDMPTTHTRVPGGSNHSIGPSGTPSIPTTGMPNHPGHGTSGIPSAVAPSSPSHGTSGAPNGGHTSGPSHSGAAAMDSSAPGHQPNGTSATAQPGVTQYATGSPHSPADDSQNPLGATIPAKSDAPIPAPPKSEPPIPAPPQADTPSANTPSETHHAGHTGADTPHRADSPTTKAEGAGETPTDNKHKTEYGSTEPDGAGNAATLNTSGGSANGATSTPIIGAPATDQHAADATSPPVPSAGVDRRKASVGTQGTHEYTGSFGGNNPSRKSHGADSYSDTADVADNAEHAGHGAHGVSNSADVGGNVSDASRGTHAAGSPTGQGGSHANTDTGTPFVSATPAQRLHRADPSISTDDTHSVSRADSTPGHGNTQRAGQGTDGRPGVSPHDTADAPTTPKKETPDGEAPISDKQPHTGKAAVDAPTTHADEATDTAKADHGSNDGNSSRKADTDDKSGHDSREHADTDPKAKDHSANGETDDAENPKDTDDKRTAKKEDTDTHHSGDTDSKPAKEHKLEDLHDHSHDGKRDPAYDPEADPHTKYEENYDTPPDPSIDQNLGFPEGVNPYTTPPQTRRQLQEALEACPGYEQRPLPEGAEQWHSNRYGFDDVVNPAHALGVNPDGSPRSMRDFMEVFYDKEKQSPVWPYDVAGERKNGALLNKNYHEYTSIQPFISEHSADLCRLGDPDGKFAAAIYKDGTLPSFGERGLYPFSLGAPDMRARLTGKLPEGHIVKYGEVAPAFGQPGGAIQLQISGPDRVTGKIRELTLKEWKERGIIEYVREN